MHWGGDFVFLFLPAGRSFALKGCPWDRNFDEKISDPGLARLWGGGMATGHIDTCIKKHCKIHRDP